MIARPTQGEHEIWLAAWLEESAFALRGSVVELAERWPEVNYWAV